MSHTPKPEVIIQPHSGDLKRRAELLDWMDRNAAKARQAKAQAEAQTANPTSSKAKKTA